MLLLFERFKGTVNVVLSDLKKTLKFFPFLPIFCHFFTVEIVGIVDYQKKNISVLDTQMNVQLGLSDGTLKMPP